MGIGAVDDILVFSVAEMPHALPLAVVEKVELAVEVTPIPEAPRVVLGAITWRGQILPVLSMRRRLHLQERRIRTSDRIIIARSSRRLLALVVDEVTGVRKVDAGEFTDAHALSERLGCVAGAVRIEDGIVLILDLDMFLSAEDERALAMA